MDAATAVTAARRELRRSGAMWAPMSAAVLVLFAGVWQGVLMSTPTNDDFLHLALAQHLLAGDVPVRDFFDNGLALQFTLSAAGQALVGHRLLSEALVVGTAWAVSAFAVYWLVRRLTGSAVAAALAVLLLVVSGPRGYSYPKIVVYAVAAPLWWSYVTNPTTGRLVALGAWAAAAFYWRPDHGAYVAAGVVLAAFAAHEPRRAVLRSVAAGAVALALTAPFFVLVHSTVGLPEYIATGFAQAGFQHEGGHDVPAWPLRGPGDLVRIDPKEAYAPRIGIRWSEGSSRSDRDAIERRYELTPVSSDGPDAQEVRLSDRSVDALRALINEPAIEDTAGIERGSATIPWSRWSPWARLRYRFAPLRLRVLPGLDEHTRASEAAAAVFYVLPLLFAAIVVPLRRFLATPVTAPALVAFTLFSVVVTLGLLRTPYDVRAVDGIVMAAVLLATCATVAWRAARASGMPVRPVVAAATVVLVLVTAKSVAVAGEFGERATWLAGGGTSVERMRGAWREVYARLAASPPLRFYEGRASGVSVQLAAYANACLSREDRLLVLWFAPEIYYYAGRLPAQRHLVFVPAWSNLEHEQRMTVASAERFSPPLAFASSSLDGVASGTYPGLVKYVRQQYRAAASIRDGDDVYTVFARIDRQPVRTYGEGMWPCYQ